MRCERSVTRCNGGVTRCGGGVTRCEGGVREVWRRYDVTSSSAPPRAMCCKAFTTGWTMASAPPCGIGKSLCEHEQSQST